MASWGLAFISLGSLLILYRQFFLGVLVLALGLWMFFKGRKQDLNKEKDQAEK